MEDVISQRYNTIQSHLVLLDFVCFLIVLCVVSLFHSFTCACGYNFCWFCEKPMSHHKTNVCIPINQTPAPKTFQEIFTKKLIQTGAIGEFQMLNQQARQ